MPTEAATVLETRSSKYLNPSELVDLARYPITDRSSKGYADLITFCREQLLNCGACVLPGFVHQKGVADMADEAAELALLAHHNTVVGNAYLTEIDPTLPETDARRMTDTTSLGAVAYDQMPASSLLRRLYEWDFLMEFLADALGKERLFRYADPMGALNIAVMGDGDYLRWHFDQTDFVTTILLQPGLAGGEYEFVPMIRSGDKPNYEHVKAVLNGSREGVITLDIQPGGLVLFEGRNSLHRVTEVQGAKARLIALLGYDTKPGTTGSEYLRQIRYGRAKPLTENQ